MIRKNYCTHLQEETITMIVNRKKLVKSASDLSLDMYSPTDLGGTRGCRQGKYLRSQKTPEVLVAFFPTDLLELDPNFPPNNPGIASQSPPIGQSSNLMQAKQANYQSSRISWSAVCRQGLLIKQPIPHARVQIEGRRRGKRGSEGIEGRDGPRMVQTRRRGLMEGKRSRIAGGDYKGGGG
ncbi:hypothetical protein BO83DRAFT_111027 [Aspergillus eucalypticola CBS 122712]|uniref:Uncharacterized protein n=1 Tax=Aspergillus eucalypticola (strain CBS 122712 / IBT 29274) TaxID=1448314 RepID=A0A317UVX9_ASPEC|nr:uncharacterized protein BO83DRAFT_111027 [Aspergillus eucalypticola CBS 122712]PWY66194.1 hypothetical protein BO83DRAFT_111027 [Aspergillus eucalypticola CBS 122712]